MRFTMFLMPVLILSLLFCVVAPAQYTTQGWTEIKPLKVDGPNNGSSRFGVTSTYAASQADSTERIYFEGGDYCVDSVQFVVKTPDTARYRTALLFGNGGKGALFGTSGTPFTDYNLALGVGLDTASSAPETGGLWNGMYTATLVPPGAQWMALVVQFSAAGNHVSTTELYEVWAKIFYRQKRVNGLNP